MSNYLLEIGTEEIPAKFMPGVLNQLETLAEKLMQQYRIKYERIETLGTPRRISLLVYHLAEKGEDLKEEVKGPAKKAAYTGEGAPTKAAEGFARSQGVAVEDLFIKDSGNGEYVFAVKEVKGKLTREVLPDIAQSLITGLSFPKPMRWGDQELRFARPIRWLVSLLDNEIIPFKLEDIAAGRITRGHRTLGHDSVVLENALVYKERLQEEYVLVDQNNRRERCWQQITKIAAELGGRVEPDEELLEEITYLLEWPTALAGSIEKSYLEMPEEVVITPMREHQRYFPVRAENGALLNHFITVRNGGCDYIAIVRQGNEKVLKARLADARFFWQEDQKQQLADYLPRLEKIVFQESLGTVAQKVDRITKSVGVLAHSLCLPAAVKQNALRAAQLCKADLVTNMVYEFPELQGIMGQYYARLSQETPEVAQAILEHYQPRHAGDGIPRSLEGALVSMADKLDTIAGCFAVGIEPTGSQDPYALRRQAMGICLIIAGHSFELKIDDLIRMALDNYGEVLPREKLGAETLARIKEFFQARIRNILTDEGHRYDVIDAVLGIDYSSLITALARARALSEMKNDPGFGDLLTSYTRAYNLTKKAVPERINPGIFSDRAEEDLYRAIGEVREKIEKPAEKGEYGQVIMVLSSLAAPIEQFFNAVMVMTEDEAVRQNRLGLLAAVVELTRSVGDLSKIVVG